MDLTSLSTAVLASRIRDRAITSLETVEAHLARIERYNPQINAVVRLIANDARARARQADAALGNGKLAGPLHGVPFTLSDLMPTALLGSSVGSRASERAAGADGMVAERLQAAGGILLGKTNTTVSLRAGSEQFGRTLNPYQRTHSAGGGGGGAAAAVAARLTPFDIAIDWQGTARVPAHFCGTFGFRPTARRLPSADVVCGPPGAARLDPSFATSALFVRSLGDIGLLLRVLSGPDAREPALAPVAAVEPRGASAKDLRIALAPPDPGSPMSTELNAKILGLADSLAKAGAHVEQAAPFTVDEMAGAVQRYEPLFMSIAMKQPSPPPSALPETAQPPTPYEVLLLTEERERYILAYEQFMAQYDALLCPVTSCLAFPNSDSRWVEIDGASVPFSAIERWSLLSSYIGAPSLVVPFALSSGGLPMGVQLLGSRWGDERLVGIGSAITGLVGVPPGPQL